MCRAVGEAAECPLPAHRGDQVPRGRLRELGPHLLHRQEHQGIYSYSICIVTHTLG